MIRTKTSMTLDYFNDFYFLQALKAKIQTQIATRPELGFQHSVTKLSQDLQAYADKVLPNIAMRTFVYIYAACLGEARHSRGEQAERLFVPETIGEERSDLFEKVYQYRPTPHNLQVIEDVFAQSWRGSFGGKAWRHIAQACKMYFVHPPETFLDHVIDLQHNSGTVFNKEESKYALNFALNYHGHFGSFLNYKFQYDILETYYEDKLYITPGVQKLLDRYAVIFRKDRITWTRAYLKPLAEYEVEWGDNELHLEPKWREWVNCSKVNCPTARWALGNAGTFDVYANNYDIEEFEQKIKDTLKEAKKLVKGYEDILPEVKKAAWVYFEEHKHYCKLKKAEKTYSIIPCKIKTVGSKIVLQVPVPFFGLGKETSYGFEIEDFYNGIHENGYDNGFDGEIGFVDGMFSQSGSNIMIQTHGNSWVYKNKQLEVILS